MVNILRFRQHGAAKPIDFLKYRYFSAALSAIILVSFVGIYFYKKNTNPDGHTFNYSVDFTGGIQTLFSFNKPISGEKLVSILDKKGWTGSVTREFSSTEHMIRVKKEAKDVAKEAEQMRQALSEGLGPDYTIKTLQTDSVGMATGTTLRANSLYAVIVALLLMLLYIALRFWSFAYAMGAIVSLFHDALVILLLFLLFDKEISMNVIGAILAVLGYSINDTIVIFARIRENVQKLPNMSMYDIINLSITETLSRTILTTFATTLVVIALLAFGGETLRDLSLALLIGIVFGIYSTIFIACPVLYALYKDTRTGKSA
jgi:preprotein translocase subunit SecF